MHLILEVDVDKLSGDELKELSRILRYWGGNLKHYPLEPGAGEIIRDSTGAAVGAWTYAG